MGPAGAVREQPGRREPERFRRLRPTAKTPGAVLSLNGITYAVVSGALAALRARAGLYVLFMLAVMALLAWYNTAVLQAFSWLGLGAVVLGMGVMALFEGVLPRLRRAARAD